MIPINMIWLSDNQGYIGYNNELLINIKNDMNRFKKLTTGKGNNAVVMGRKTFESIGSKPLPNRLNIVLSKSSFFQFKKELGEELLNCVKAMSIREVIEICEQHEIDELWVIGGAEVYQQFEELASKCYQTFVDTNLLPDEVKYSLTSYFDLETHKYKFESCEPTLEYINGKLTSVDYNVYSRY